MQTLSPPASTDAGSGPSSCPTLPDDPGPRRQRRARAMRRAFLTLLALFVLVGLTGYLGVREQRVFAAEEGWTMEVRTAHMTRAGLAVPMEWHITKAGGFGPAEAEPTVVLRVTHRYLDLYDENSVDPEPSKSWSDGEFLYFEFDAPPNSQAMHVSVDTRTGSSVQLTRMRGESAIMLDDRPLAGVRFQTWVMP